MSSSRPNLRLREGLFCSLFLWKPKIKHSRQDYSSAALVPAVLHTLLWKTPQAQARDAGAVVSHCCQDWALPVPTMASAVPSQRAEVPTLVAASPPLEGWQIPPPLSLPALRSSGTPWLWLTQAVIIYFVRARNEERAHFALPPAASATALSPFW